MFGSENDNFSTAKRTGRLLLCDGDEEEQEEIPDGPCSMRFELHSGLYLSLVTRSSGGNVINCWAAFQNIWLPCKKMSEQLFDRKNKRYKTHEKIMIDSGGTRVLRLHNETHVARVLLLLRDLLVHYED